MTALPFIESAASERVPAPVVWPPPEVVNQFIWLLGPAWKTPACGVAKSQAWLSARNSPAASWVRMALAGSPGRGLHRCWSALSTSASFPPSPPLHEPPIVNTRPSESVTVVW